MNVYLKTVSCTQDKKKKKKKERAALWCLNCQVETDSFVWTQIVAVHKLIIQHYQISVG